MAALIRCYRIHAELYDNASESQTIQEGRREGQLETSDIPTKQERKGPVHWYQQFVPPSQCGSSVETTPYDPSEESDISSSHRKLYG